MEYLSNMECNSQQRKWMHFMDETLKIKKLKNQNLCSRFLMLRTLVAICVHFQNRAIS